MGTGIEPLLLSTALSAGGKMLGGATGGGGGAPAAGGVNPLTAGLLGGQPPMPEKNELFHDSPEQEAMLGNLRKQTERNPVPFDSPENPTRTETVQGMLPGGTPAPNPASSNVGLLSAEVQRPPMARSAAPAPVRVDLGGENISRGQQFDTNAPSAPGTPPAAADGSGFGDGMSWIKGALGKGGDAIGGLSTNPMAQASLGLLASGYDGSNPWTNINNNLSGGARLGMAQTQQAEQKAERERKMKEDLLAALIQRQSAEDLQMNAGRPLTQAQGQASVVR